MAVTVVVLHYGDRKLTQRCVESVGGPVFVVDNQGDWPDADLRPEQNLGFAAGCNAAAAATSEDLLVFLNNDAVLPDNWAELLEPFADPKVGVVGCRIVDPDGVLQHAGVRMFYDWRDVLTAENRVTESPEGPVDVVTGACMAVRRDCFTDVGGFDEGFWNGYEDVDFCLSARTRGWKVWYTPTVTVEHVGAASGPERWARVHENVSLLQRKWAKPKG